MSIRGSVRFGYSWFDLALYALAVALLIPLAFRFVGSVLTILDSSD